MAERTSITQVVQVGVETTPGTAVAANKFLPSVMINTGIDGNFTEQRGSSFKYLINEIPGKEWARGALTGQPTYDELTYLLASIVSFQAPSVVGVTGQSWALVPSSSAEDPIKTYTIEQGSAVRAQKFNYGQLTELTLSGNRETISMTGSLIGRGFTDGVTLTATPTAVAAIPILPKHIDVFADPTSANLGATKLGRVLSWELSLKNRFNPLWVVDSSQSSYVATVEQAVDATFKMKLEADAAGMAFLTNARTPTKSFVRLKATSDQLAGTAIPYSLAWDMCLQVKTFPNEIADQDGVYAVEWEFAFIHDPTWGKAHTVTLVNKTATL